MLVRNLHASERDRRPCSPDSEVLEVHELLDRQLEVVLEVSSRHSSISIACTLFARKGMCESLEEISGETVIMRDRAARQQ